MRRLGLLISGLLAAGCAPSAHVAGGALADAHGPGEALGRLERTCTDPAACPRSDRGRIDFERGFLAHAAGDRRAARASLARALAAEPFWTPAAGPDDLARRVYGVLAEPYRPLLTESLVGLGWWMLAAAEAGDLDAAAKVAVRFSELRERIYATDDRDEHAAFASYLAGQIFARLGRREVSSAYFGEVLATRESLLARAALARLESRTDPLSAAYLAVPRPADDPAHPGISRTVVLVAAGHVPPLRAERIPVAYAWTLAGPYLAAMDATDAAERLEAMGISEVVVPDLAPAARRVDAPELWIDEHRIRLELLSDVSSELAAEFRRLRRPLAAAALVRAAAGQDPMFLLHPDTRSVTTLPARIYAAEVDLPPGLHQIRAQAVLGGRERRAATAVRTRDGDVAFVGLTVL